MMERNFLVDKQTCSYGNLWNAMKRITESYSALEKQMLYSGTGEQRHGRIG
jgi:L-fuconolactonase